MRKFLQIAGILALVIVAALAGTVAMVVYSGSQLDSESKQFVDNAVPAISKDWDKQELMRRASAEMAQATGADQMDRYFRLFSTLGHLTTYEGAKGDSNFSIVLGSPSVITANYTAKARFENGEAAIRVGLVKRSGQWLIKSWNVTPIGPVRTAMSTHA